MRSKRIFDIHAALAGLIVLSPLLLLISLLILISMPGPVFFRQQRVGRQGRLFTIYKFRSMRLGHGGNSITVKGESRITPLGAWLRKFKIDELPELWNVLRGDMSFVGPRPDVPGYADQLQGPQRLILSVRPGLTGAASLIYNNEEELLARQPDPVWYNNHVLYPDKVRIDLAWIQHRTFLLDLKIILFTLLGKRLKETWADLQRTTNNE